jgi:hypothetical protein
MHEEVKNYWTQTYLRTKFCLNDPKADQVSLSDIAHALSMTCRFAGQTTEFRSVAEHSVLVSQFLWDHCPGDPNRLLLTKIGLLHDAAEAYIGDHPRPMKRIVPGIEVVEQAILRAVWERFGIDKEAKAIGFDLVATLPGPVIWADDILLATEARDYLIGGPINDWHLKILERWPGAEPLSELPQAMSSQAAEVAFHQQAQKLGIV